MKSRISSLGLPAALLSVSLFAACQNTARGVEQDTERNTAEAKQEAREANAEVEAGSSRANAGSRKPRGRNAERAAIVLRRKPRTPRVRSAPRSTPPRRRCRSRRR